MKYLTSQVPMYVVAHIHPMYVVAHIQPVYIVAPIQHIYVVAHIQPVYVVAHIQHIYVVAHIKCCMSATIRCSTHTAHMYVVAHIQTVSNYFLPTVCASAVTSCYIRLRLVSRHLSCLSCQMQVTCLQAETGENL